MAHVPDFWLAKPPGPWGGKFPLGLVHPKKKPQVPKIQCFPCTFRKNMGLVCFFLADQSKWEINTTGVNWENSFGFPSGMRRFKSQFDIMFGKNMKSLKSIENDQPGIIRPIRLDAGSFKNINYTSRDEYRGQQANNLRPWAPEVARNIYQGIYYMPSIHFLIASKSRIYHIISYNI